MWRMECIGLMWGMVSVSSKGEEWLAVWTVDMDMKPLGHHWVALFGRFLFLDAFRTMS